MCCSDKEPNFFREGILNSWELVEKENKYNKVFFSNKYLCTICEHDIDVCNDATSIKSHLMSSIHKNNLSLVDVSHRYYCHPCNFIMQDEIWYEVHKLHSWHNERLIDYQKTANVDLEFEESECEDCGVISFGFKEMLPEHIHSTFKLKNPCDQEKVSCSDCNRSIPFSSNYVVIHLGEDTEDFGMQFSEALQELNQKRFVEFEYIGSKEVNQSGSLVIKLECLEEYVNVELPLLDKIHIGMDIVQLWKSGKLTGIFTVKNKISQLL
ncbi:uncharacterized protein LOC113367127 [Ctenocephalides felis]|uniref:uncharacterized protein LOC113367127 n=1 Tax=Ctenocephalides felis TaxID=7515 RepID=UPI000E6E5098|nr:uncharacterized protein LOC113367127 [Ctenocephalides felis]